VTFYYKGKLQEVFRAGLNEIKYDYVGFKQHFYLQHRVAAIYMKILQKTNISSSGVARVSRAWGQTKRFHLVRSWQHKIKYTLQSDALLAII